MTTQVTEARFASPINNRPGFYVQIKHDGYPKPGATKKAARLSVRDSNYKFDGETRIGFPVKQKDGEYTQAIWFYDRIA